MTDLVFLKWIRVVRAASMASLAMACMVWLSSCATTRYYNITDFDTVVVDAGHGGRDAGATARLRRRCLQEKDLTLDVAQRLAVKLKDAGFHVVRTRANDRYISLDDRVDVSNAHRKSVFVSIHFNDARRRKVHGVETYHNREGTWQLSARIQRYLSAMPKGEDRGVKTAGYRVLRKSRGPAILVECGFLSNPAEAARCADPAWRDQVATRIARAIIAQRQP